MGDYKITDGTAADPHSYDRRVLVTPKMGQSAAKNGADLILSAVCRVRSFFADFIYILSPFSPYVSSQFYTIFHFGCAIKEGDSCAV